MWERTEWTNISIVRVPGWEEKERSKENTGSNNDLKHPKFGKKKKSTHLTSSINHK